MKFISFICISILTVFSITSAQEPVLIRGVQIVDVEDGTLSTPSDIIFRDGRIQIIRPTLERPFPEGSVIDARGKYVIPGLYDMHVHALHPGQSDRALDLMLANGVTGFRDTWGFLPLATQIRETMASGQRPVQRFKVAGNLIDGENPIWPGANVAATAEEGRELVRELISAGAEFIKVYTKLPPDVFFAIADEARSQGIDFIGHVPAMVSALEASNAGMKSMEHFYGIIEACSTVGDSVYRLFSSLLRADSMMSHVAETITLSEQLTLHHQDPGKTDTLINTLVRNNTWQVPTIVTLRNYSHLRDTILFYADPRLKYIDPATLAQWSPGRHPLIKHYTDEHWQVKEDIYQLNLKLIDQFHEHNVPFLAGSDPLNPFCFYGFSLHDELALMVEKCGFTPAEALQTATSNAAVFFGWENDAGTVEPGKYADLVILTANPLENIRNTTQIDAVITNGEYLDRAALDNILARWAGE